VHRTIIVVDVEAFGDGRRTNQDRVSVRAGLHRAMRSAFGAAGVPWADCRHEDCGDGVFVLAPADIPKAPFVDAVPHTLAAALGEHNATHPAEERIRLRMALHAGEVTFDEHGVTAASINHTFRLVDAPPLKAALAESPGLLAVITSEWFFDEVVRHSREAVPATYRPVRVEVKETSTVGWISLPDHPYPPDPTHLATPVSVLRQQLPAPQPPLRAETTAIADAVHGRLTGVRAKLSDRQGAEIRTEMRLGTVGKSGDVTGVDLSTTEERP
jgi:hypothetical protein